MSGPTAQGVELAQKPKGPEYQEAQTCDKSSIAPLLALGLGGCGGATVKSAGSDASSALATPDIVAQSSLTPESTATLASNSASPASTIPASQSTLPTQRPQPTPDATASPAPPPTSRPQPTPSPSAWDANARHPYGEAATLALRASLAITAGDAAYIRRSGYVNWLRAGIVEPIGQTATEWLTSKGFNRVDENRYYYATHLMDAALWSQLMAGGNSIRKRFALALADFFVVSIHGLETEWAAQAITHYWDLLNEHAFGNFRELLEAVTVSPAMGLFLDTKGNRKADPATGRVPDENFAREIMQLFSIGLHQLNEDGTPILEGGRQIETYSNEDVIGLAKVFTGYDLDFEGVEYQESPASSGAKIPDVKFVCRPMTTNPSRWEKPEAETQHSSEEKSFLGTTIPAGTDAPTSLRIALDTLFEHPNVGPFFGKQMIQRLVTSNPTPAYVARVSRVFADNGRGERGDLAAVFLAVLTDQEALAYTQASSLVFGKLREPTLRMAQWGRTFQARSASGDWHIYALSSPNLLGQSPFRAPSVFNFFSPSYTPPNSQSSQSGLLAPEFQLVDDYSVAAYANTMWRAIKGDVYFMGDIKADYENELKITDSGDLLDHLDLLLTGAQLSPTSREMIRAAMDSVHIDGSSSEAERLRRIHIGITLIMASNDYIIQK